VFSFNAHLLPLRQDEREALAATEQRFRSE
jgi:hypothetical protein